MRINRNHQLVGESKPARAIRRHNHGLSHKHGVIGRYFAESKRERWLRDHGKPIIPLSTQGGF